MEKKRYIKKCFKEKMQNGYQFFYINKDNTIMEYCLKRDMLNICFVEDYRHEYLYLKVIWDSKVLLVSVNENQCSSKINCNYKKELEKLLNNIYNSLSGKCRGTLSDQQFKYLVEVYKIFLQNNNYFEDFSL